MNKRLLLLAGLVVLIWLGVYFQPEHTPEEKADASWPAFALASTDRVDLEHAGKTASLRKETGEWFAPADGAAAPGLRLDINKVDALLRYVESHPPKRRLGAPGAGESKNFGLDKPAASITFYGESQWKIQLGAKNATATGMFAESSKESGELLLLDTGYAEQFARGASHYYDLRLLALQPETVARIKLENDGGDGWEIAVTDEKPAFTWPADITQKKVSLSEFNGYLRDLAALKGTAFVLDKAQAQGRELAKLRIWKKGAGDPVVIRILHPAGAPAQPDAAALVALSSWQNAPLALEARARAQLIRPAFSLRDRRVLELSPGQVERQIIRRGAANGQPPAELAAQKSEAGWKTAGKERQGLDMLLWRLSDLQYEGEPADQLAQGAQEELTWQLIGENDKPLHTLFFYRVPGETGGSKSAHWIAVDEKAPYYPVSAKLAGDLAAMLPVPTEPAAPPAGDAQPAEATQ